jgi:hypothetical protein
MTDYIDPKVWLDGLNLVTAAPHVVVPILIVAALAAWWFRGHTKSGEIAGLKEQAKAATDWRNFAENRAKTAEEQLSAAQATNETLKRQIEAGAEKEVLAATAETTSREITAANNEVKGITGSYRFEHRDIVFGTTDHSPPAGPTGSFKQRG